jgi:hypothetical protein
MPLASTPPPPGAAFGALPDDAAGVEFPAGAAAARPSRGGQITPSQPRSLHLKSGAFGLRLFSRLSHTGP